MEGDRADEIAVNRALWAVVNERFTGPAAEGLWSRREMVWGLYETPEDRLGALGEVADRPGATGLLDYVLAHSLDQRLRGRDRAFCIRNLAVQRLSPCMMNAALVERQ